ncbi:MAG: hypothetical protein ACRDIV_08120, partial [Ktedonobacteraceae bacterium]
AVSSSLRIAWESKGISSDVSDEMRQAMLDYINADDWDATRRVIEAQQVILFKPEVEALFEQFIVHARSAGDQHFVNLLEQHLELLRDCKMHGIEKAFERFESDLAEAEKEDLPFDAELIVSSVMALLGSPQEKMGHAQSLMAQAAQTSDEELKALLTVIQLALFSSDLSQLGRDLQGVYRQAWETIAASVEAGGVDPRLFEAVVRNTLAVLGPASNQRVEWRNSLVDLRNQAMAHGDRNMAALLEAAIGLLDAGGNPAGLGEGLQGIYSRTWQRIIQGLAG